MTPTQWSQLSPATQQAHIARYGPPPPGWAPVPYPVWQPMYQPPPPPVVNVAVAQAMAVGRPPVNHLLHLILTLLTGGLWAFVWIAIVIFRR